MIPKRVREDRPARRVPAPRVLGPCSLKQIAFDKCVPAHPHRPGHGPGFAPQHLPLRLS